MELLKRLSLIALLVVLSQCSGVPARGYILEAVEGHLLKIPSTFVNPNSVPINLKLVGITCADRNSDNLKEAYYGSLAKLRSKGWVKRRQVILERPLKNEKGTPLRKWGWIKDAQTGEYLHEILLKEGLAVAHLQERDLGKMGQRITQLEQEARSSKVGMWAEETPKEFEMRETISDASTIVGQFSDTVSDMFGGDEEETVTATDTRPDQTAKPDTTTEPPVQQQHPDVAIGRDKGFASRTLKDHLLRVNALASRAEAEYLVWDTSTPADQNRSRAGVRQAIRAAKIYIMDVLDEVEGLSNAQRQYLADTRLKLNDYLKKVK